MQNRLYSLLRLFLPHALVILAFGVVAFFLNKIPDGSIIANGDFYQLINYQENFARYLYLWFHQNWQWNFNPLVPAAPFYFLLGQVERFFWADIIPEFILFASLCTAYLLFYISSKTIELDDKYRLLGAIIYSINTFSLSLFTYSWWFTHHMLFYLFVPPLIFYPVAYLRYGRKVDLTLFVATFVLSQTAYSNIAFLFAYGFLGVIFVLILISCGVLSVSRPFLRRVLIIIILACVTVGPYLFAFYISNISSVGQLVTSKALGWDIGSWIIYTSGASFIELFWMVMEKTRILTSSSVALNWLIQAATTIYGIVLLALVFRSIGQRWDKDALSLAFLIFLVSIFLLSIRAYWPFQEIWVWLYSLPGFSVFRSPEKIFIFIPFVFTTTILLYLKRLTPTKNTTVVIAIVFLLLPINLYAWWIGNFLAKETRGTLSPESRYGQLVRIPDEYYHVSEIVNDDPVPGRIISLPYSVVNSINWVNYPKWHFLWHDILHMLFRREYIYANSHDHTGFESKLTFKDLNDNGGATSSEFMNALQKFWARYVLYHYDIEPYWIQATSPIKAILDSMVQEGWMKNILTNSYVSLYKLEDAFVTPKITATGVESISFLELNPTHYRVILKWIHWNVNLKFRDSYNQQWWLYLWSAWSKLCPTTACSGTQLFSSLASEMRKFSGEPELENTHQLGDDYLNEWNIDLNAIKKQRWDDFYRENADGSIDLELSIYFRPQILVYVWALINCLISIWVVVSLGGHIKLKLTRTYV